MQFQKIKHLKDTHFGVSLGYKYLDLLLTELKKKKTTVSNAANIIFDYRDQQYFNVNFTGDELNNFVQTFYVDFFVKEQLHKSEAFVTTYNGVLKELKVKDLNNVYFKVIEIIFMWLKRLICAKPINGFNISDFFENIIIFMNHSVSSDFEMNKQLLIIIFKIMLEKSIIEYSNEVYFRLKDVEFFCKLQFMRYEMVDIFSDTLIIKYSCDYGLSQLYTIIQNYKQNTNKLCVSDLTLLILLRDYTKLDYAKLFATDFNAVEFLPQELKFLASDPKATDCFNAIFFQKWVLNEYCFQTIATSCFQNYYFNFEKINNILLQKIDPQLNLN